MTGLERMIEDARQCNARLRKNTGTGYTVTSEAKQRLAAEVRARRENQQTRVLEFLRNGPATVSQIMASCHLADHTARECLLALEADGLAAKQGGYMRGAKAVWGVRK